MIANIQIKNFAIVDQLSLDLQTGMTVLTGETGAGKSILLDALNLALGDRADSGNIRHGAERAEISVLFQVEPDSLALSWLQEQSLDEDDECLIRRVISREGRSRGFINGSPVPMQSLKTLGEMLVDIHGQHEHQSLLKRDIQRQLLDDYAGNQSLLNQLSNCYRLWRQKQDELASLKQNASDRQARIELLQYQVTELDKLALLPDELTSLTDEQQKLANADHLRNTTQQNLHELYESEQGNLHQSLSHIIRSLEELQTIDPALKDVIDMLHTAAIQVQESGSDLRNYLDNIELDPEKLAWVEDRLGWVHELSRKHQIEPGALSEHHQQLLNELGNLKQDDQNLDSLDAELSELASQYQTLASNLGKQRSKAAKKLNKTVTTIIRELGMPSTEFEIQLISTNAAHPSINGNEEIEFMICPNPGQPAKPLRKIASGGELSRISLAIQTVLANTTHIPTLIYDEVDAGIGGPTAEVVGKNLRTLGSNHQILCVTHLAQVASQAHQHLKVSKTLDKKSTSSAVTTLNPEQRIEETARMLGGLDLTEQSLSHAREMIEHAQESKKRKQA